MSDGIFQIPAQLTKIQSMSNGTTEMETKKGVRIKIDEDDVQELQKYNWYIGSHGYAMASVEGKHRLMHRVILSAPPHLQVDHINGNRLDNRKNNLRLCTQQENKYNSKNRWDSTTGLRGVMWDKRRKKYLVQVRASKKIVYSKRFSDIKEAVTARNEVVKKYHGEFARLV